MQITRHPPVRTSLAPSNHPYLTGPWTPLHEEDELREYPKEVSELDV